jgi:glycosyltransferase involved in cell wall biosynthesis
MSHGKTRICLATDSREPSGVGRHILDLAAALDDRYSIIVAAPAAPPARDFLDGARRLGLEVWELPDADRPVQAVELGARLMRSPVDLLHVHAGITWEGHDLAAAGRAAGTAPIVRTEHCPYVLTKLVDHEEYAAGIRAVDRIVCVSEGVAASFRAAGVPHGLLGVVRNGIAERRGGTPRSVVRAELGVSPTAPLAVTVARLTEQKGHADLLRVIPDVLMRVPDARFVWVGDGPEELRLREQLRHNGIEEHVAIVPRHRDVPALLAAADAVVLPSRFEGLPLVALEAMAAGTPVIGMAVVGLDEAVRDGVTGRLVPARDCEALAAALIEVLTERELARRWGANGEAWQREEFTAWRMAAETAAVYEEVMAGATAGSAPVLAAAGR